MAPTGTSGRSACRTWGPEERGALSLTGFGRGSDSDTSQHVRGISFASPPSLPSRSFFKLWDLEFVLSHRFFFQEQASSQLPVFTPLPPPVFAFSLDPNSFSRKGGSVVEEDYFVKKSRLLYYSNLGKYKRKKSPLDYCC